MQYEQEAAERKARGETTEDTVADVHSRVQQLMMEANEKLLFDMPPAGRRVCTKKVYAKSSTSRGKGRGTTHV